MEVSMPMGRQVYCVLKKRLINGSQLFALVNAIFLTKMTQEQEAKMNS